MGGLWREVSECTDDKLGMAHIEHTETQLSAVHICLWERDRPQCGKWPSFDTELMISSLLLSVMEKFSLV